MAKIGYGYGSEWHLLRHLGYHREYLSQNVLAVTGGSSVEWLDCEFSSNNAPLRDDKEWVGLDFIHDTRTQERWNTFWPQTGNAHHWDAVGKISSDTQDEWLLVEAKGHIGEINSTCGARNSTSKQTIMSALTKASHAFGNLSQPAENWFGPYYQYANRLAALYFLMKECVPSVDAHIVFIYFYGESRKNCVCPNNKQEWLPTLQTVHDWLGIDKDCELSQRIHTLFLPVNPVGHGVRPMSR